MYAPYVVEMAKRDILEANVVVGRVVFIVHTHTGRIRCLGISLSLTLSLSFSLVYSIAIVVKVSMCGLQQDLVGDGNQQAGWKRNGQIT